MYSPPPNAYFADSMMLLTDGRGLWSAATAAWLQCHDLRQALPSVLNRLQEALRVFLRGFSDQLRMQFVFLSDGDYRDELARYDQETERAANEYVRAYRTERSRYYQARLRRGELRRQRLVIFVSCRFPDRMPMGLTANALRKGHQALLDALANDLSLAIKAGREILAPHGFALTPLRDADYYLLYTRLLNPSFADWPDYDAVATFDASLSLHENCLHGEAVATSGFFQLDGYYHALLVVARWPQATYPGIIQKLTHLSGIHYQTTLNIEGLSVQQQIKLAERKHARLKGEYDSQHTPSLLTVLEKLETRIQQLMKGVLRPFQTQFIVRVWDRSPSALVSALSAVKQAVNSMGAQFFQPALPATLRKLFYQSWPGWLWGNYRHFMLYAEDSYLADLLPISSSFTGYLAEAEALFEGPQDSLVGVKTISKPELGGAPQHAVIFGMTGGGKSKLLWDLLIQTAPYFDLTILLDNGLALEKAVPFLDPSTRPLILRPNGNLSLNYLDTQQLPLTADHVAQAAALTSLMCGGADDDGQERLRRAFLAKYIQQLYQDVFEEWSRRQPQGLEEAARLCCALEERRRHKPDHTLLESFVEFREWTQRDPAQAAQCLQRFTEPEWVAAIKSPATREKVRALAFTQFSAGLYPTHRMLKELLQLDAARSDRELACQLSLLLEPWCANGSHGPLFDGASNVSLAGALIYFELGQIPDSAVELKAAVIFLVQNWMWQRIFTRPHSLRKRLIIEETSAFLSMPGAAAIVQRNYEQCRKHNTYVVSVFQQYGRLQASPIRPAVMGNSQQFFLLRQNDGEDLRQLAADLGLSRTAVDEILRYPKPEVAGYSAFTYFHRDTPHSICGTAYYKLLDEVECNKTTR